MNYSSQIDMEYNSSRPRLNIPEYGRNLQKMVEYACTVKDKDLRNTIAQTIVNIMAQMHPQVKDIEEFNHKLWDHLFIMSDYQLEVDAPFPKPEREDLNKTKERLTYPSGKIRYKHYGRNIEQLILKGIEMEEGEEKEAYVKILANLMKRSYLSWNRDSVNEQVILDHLNELSKGKLKLKDDFVFEATNEILAKNYKKKKRPKNNNGRKKRN